MEHAASRLYMTVLHSQGLFAAPGYHSEPFRGRMVDAGSDSACKRMFTDPRKKLTGTIARG